MSCEVQAGRAGDWIPAEVEALADNDSAYAYADGWNACRRAMLATAPAAPSAPASFPGAIWQLLLTVADRKGTEYTGPWEGPNGEPMQDDADAAIAWIKARSAAPAAAPADARDAARYRALRAKASFCWLTALPEPVMTITLPAPHHSKYQGFRDDIFDADVDAATDAALAALQAPATLSGSQP